MNTEETVKALSSMTRQQLFDTLECLMDSGVFSVKDFFDLYDRRMMRIKSNSLDKVHEAEGVVYTMLYPLLYDTKKLSDAGKRAAAEAIKFVESLGFHRTEEVRKKLNAKED